MPSQKTVPLTIRVHPSLRAAAQKVARGRDETISQVLRRALAAYVETETQHTLALLGVPKAKK